MLKTYKGTDKDMRCRDGFQYEPGKTYEQETATVCGPGFHSCEAPLDVLRYFGLKNGNRYFESVADGVIARKNDGDSKIASSKLTIGAEIGLPGLIKAHMEYTRKKAESGTTGGNRSNLAGGDDSNLAGGDWSAIIGRNKCKAKAGLHSILCLSEWGLVNNEYAPVSVKAVIVDGETIKPGTWYTLKNGELVEAYLD